MHLCTRNGKVLKYGILALIAVISTAMHYPHLKKDLISYHVWRQTQTQTVINNFYEEDFNILNPRINKRGNGDGEFRMEFPIMQWLVAGIYKITGPSVTVTRIIMLLIGFIAIIGLYSLLNQLFNNTFVSAAGAWAFAFSPSFYYYTINPMPDNFALAAGIWGLAFSFKWYDTYKTRFIILSSFMISLAALAKLPFILYYTVPAATFIRQCLFNKPQKKCISLLVYPLLFVIFPAAWYISVIPGWHGNKIVSGILSFDGNFLQLLDYYQHNLISTLPELLINYGALLFFLSSFYFIVKHKIYKHDKFFPLALSGSALILYYLFEANTIAKVHDYYLFVFYPYLFILVAYGIKKLMCNNKPFITGFSLLLLLILPVTCYLRMKNRWDLSHPGFNKDLYTYKEELRQAVPDTALVVAGSDESGYIFLYYIHKKGWTFNNALSHDELEKMIANGAQYLYADTITNTESFYSLIDTRLARFGSINIYKLKTQSNRK